MTIGYSGALCHRRINNHKYIAKVKISNGKYRYFYDSDQYAAYLENKRKFKSGAMSLGRSVTKRIINSFGNSTYKHIQGVAEAALLDAGREAMTGVVTVLAMARNRR